MNKYLPFLSWLKVYNTNTFKSDLIAGLTVGIMLIPQGMAYALLAGLPPIYGLYAATVPLVVYAFLGTAWQLAIGPVALDAILIYAGVSSFATPESSTYIQYVFLLMLMVGVIQLFMGVFKMGFLVNFLSKPVISGFTTAAAIIIAVSQLPYILGIEIERSGFASTLFQIFQKLGTIDGLTLGMSLGAIFLLFILKRLNPNWPRLLWVVLLGMGTAYFFNLESIGLSLLGDVPSGFPKFTFETIEINKVKELLPMAFTLAFIGFMESIAVGKSLEIRQKEYEIDPNQELRAIGLANMLGSFFKGMPVSGGFSRSAVNVQAGARTGIATLISAVVVALSLLFLTTYFYYLPFAILGSIIIVSVLNLMEADFAKFLWRTDKKDFLVFMATLLVTLIFGIKEGIIFGVLLSLALLVYKQSNPHIAVLGRVPGSKEFRNVERFEKLEVYKGILIFRFDALLYFANAGKLRDFIRGQIKQNEELDYIIFEAASISSVDSSAMMVLQGIVEELKQNNVKLYIVDVKGPVRDVFSKNAFLSESENLFFALNTDRALERILHKDSKKYAGYTFQGA